MNQNIASLIHKKEFDNVVCNIYILFLMWRLPDQQEQSVDILCAARLLRWDFDSHKLSMTILHHQVF